MTKQVRETAAGKSLSVYVILNKKGAHVATVQAHFSNGGVCTVDVWNTGDSRTDYGLTQGRAGGYGYDKFTAALSNLVIDGHEMTDHCASRLSPPKGRTTWPSDAKAPTGYRFANFQTFTYGKDGERVPLGVESPAYGYTSCYRESGLGYLKALGYRVIQAL